MPDENYFDNVLTNVRKQVEKNGDLTDALENNLSDLLHGIVDQPLDCGVRRFRSISLSRQSGEERSGERVRSAWLLGVRGIDDAGDDVVCWTGEDTWIECIVNFAHRAATGSLEWKADKKPGDRKRYTSFIDSLVTDDNGSHGNGAYVRGGRSAEKGGLGSAGTK